MDCRFYVWIDGEHDTFMKTLLLDLRDGVWRLKKECEELNKEVVCDDGQRWEKEIQELQEMNQLLAKENIDKIEQLRTKEIKLAEKNATIQVMAAKISSGNACSSFSCIVFVFLFGLVVGLMLGGVMFA